MVKKGTFASPAIALANKVLPVPGGPTIKIPFGILPPRFWNFFGSRKKSTTSPTSSFASSQPATSAKVTLIWSWFSILARLLPKLMALPPPPCIWRMKKIHTPTRNSIGNHEIKICDSKLRFSKGVPSILTFLFNKSSKSFLSSNGGITVIYLEPSFLVTVISFASKRASFT